MWVLEGLSAVDAQEAETRSWRRLKVTRAAGEREYAAGEEEEGKQKTEEEEEAEAILL